ncbi:hypothetical protein F5890DRAFT_487485 [Lentinula detonsa]|uniref:Uncharacterized protein n=1 Tax=Lentinula detonsa TaxID=2804962 RepID=A0AA38PU77_9AGAR|nr:hypothetical protein F5890DRAFT_487485 [Lentinula detonsa]
MFLVSCFDPQSFSKRLLCTSRVLILSLARRMAAFSDMYTSRHIELYHYDDDATFFDCQSTFFVFIFLFLDLTEMIICLISVVDC